MIRVLIIIAATALATLPTTAQSYPTIVGEWYAEEIGPQDCGGPHAVHIGPMHYVEEALSCDFQDVARDGWEVTRTGSCNDGSTVAPMRLVATEDNGRLSLLFNNKPGWSTLHRCTAKSGAAPAAVERVPLVYTAHAADSAEARTYWGDVVDMVQTLDPPPKVPVAVRVAEGAGYTFAYITGGGVCGTGQVAQNAFSWATKSWASSAPAKTSIPTL